MDRDLVEEIEYLIEVLTKSGFFNIDEIQEILEDQFIEEDIDFSQFNISLNDFDNVNFNKLECAFNSLVEKDILAVHNCGFDIEEGVADAFELQVHLLNNKFNPVGFCFYTFEDVEEAIWDNKLKITFSDFENNEKKALEIGEIAAESLKSEGFSIIWDGTVNSQIEINPFKWDKSFDSEKEYEIEGAYECFINKDVLK
ncbi:MAG: hypothetical protein E7Z81_06875 [Methanobrevibacter sp.]|uniref:DUF6891 domain-containing protein n=1 Tax=Methanobrevibacter sp. TaxID=66852 RepID=UPI0025D04D54|nr:hypothetical protein [Methanobrevibacter sp.]MBE6497986.1 hypothetical protein [Methanobrevibacter sp.]